MKIAAGSQSFDKALMIAPVLTIPTHFTLDQVIHISREQRSAISGCRQLAYGQTAGIRQIAGTGFPTR